MEKYGELITNGLDLISFLLVTPEILSKVVPTATSIIRAVFGTLVLILATSLLLLPGVEAIVSQPPEPSDWVFYPIFLMFAALIVVSIAIPLLRRLNPRWKFRWFSPGSLRVAFIFGERDLSSDLERAYERVDRIAKYISRNLLWIGVVLFFISRVIAFYGSAVKIGLLHS